MAQIYDETVILEEEERETACEDVVFEEQAAADERQHPGRTIDADEVNDEAYDDDVDDDDTPAVLPAPVREHREV